MNDLAMNLQGIHKHFGGTTPLDDVSFQVPRGSIYALLGLNGAGKSTLIRILMGLLFADRGSGTVLGYPLGSGYPTCALKERIGYVPERPALWARMSARELLEFARSMHPRWDEQGVRRYLNIFDLPTNRPVRSFSPGMRSQLALTLAMGGNPDLLILDEPTLGLDPLHRHQYLQVLLADAMDNGRTVFLSSHDLHQIERLADHVAILHNGKMVIDTPLDMLKDQYRRIRLAIQGDADELKNRINNLPDVRHVSLDGAGLLVTVYGDLAILQSKICSFPGVTASQCYEMGLEEVFLDVCGM